MSDLEVLKNFYYEYTKINSEEDLKNRIINFFINETSDEPEEDEIIIKNKKIKDKEYEKEFIERGLPGNINALLQILCSTNINEYKDIKEEIIRLIHSGNIEDIEKILYFELRFYNRVDHERLIDNIIDCYIETMANNLDINVDKNIENKLAEYYGNEESRIKEAEEWVDNNFRI